MSFVTTAIRGVMSPEKSSASLPAAGSLLESQEIAMKTPYFKKLLDPRWQKKRLEALEAAEWRCESCMDDSSTLHVHHKQYFKGREPWEYETAQLAVLCAECHENSHADVDPLQWVSSFAPVCGPLDRFDASWLLAGALGMPTDAVPDYPHAKTMSFLGGVAVAMANKVWLCQGVSGFSSLDRLEVADVAVKAVFEHFNLSIERKQEFR